MKEILHLMRFDYLTACGSVPVYLICMACAAAAGLFLTPIFAFYAVFIMFVLTVPLQKKTEQKVYGVLPVSRKNIARARLLYFWAVMFVTELISVTVGLLSVRLKLSRFVLPQDSQFVQMNAESFDMPAGEIILIGAVFFAVIGAFMLYMEMMGEIFGRENEMKILVISLGVLIALVFGFFALSANDILPMLSFEGDSTYPLVPSLIKSIVWNLAVFVLACIFGEITARVQSRREL